eukprot:8188926-Pyramimonas_sp.AAC.1
MSAFYASSIVKYALHQTAREQGEISHANRAIRMLSSSAPCFHRAFPCSCCTAVGAKVGSESFAGASNLEMYSTFNGSNRARHVPQLQGDWFKNRTPHRMQARSAR